MELNNIVYLMDWNRLYRDINDTADGKQPYEGSFFHICVGIQKENGLPGLFATNQLGVTDSNNIKLIKKICEKDNLELMAMVIGDQDDTLHKYIITKEAVFKNCTKPDIVLTDIVDRFKEILAADMQVIVNDLHAEGKEPSLVIP